MVTFMWRMYRSATAKIIVVAASIIGGLALLTLNRSQTFIRDTDFMKAMIPHHSIAINNARKAGC